MKRRLHNIWLFFCTFSGEDDYIIRKCSGKTQLTFALIGFFVILIFLACLESARLFMLNLFDGAEFLGTFVGLVWSLLITNLYLLLLYTISPTLLPVADKKKKKKSFEGSNKAKKIFTSSFILRILLIILLAVIITQPYNVLIFSPSFEASHHYAQEIRRILSTVPLAWLTTISGCLLFLVPIYWKYELRGGEFYEKKREIEQRFVIDTYLEFGEKYSSILHNQCLQYNQKTWENLMPLLNKLEKVNPKRYKELYQELSTDLQAEAISVYEYWEDHPFRTIKKNQAKSVATEEEFLNNIYTKWI